MSEHQAQGGEGGGVTAAVREHNNTSDDDEEEEEDCNLSFFLVFTFHNFGLNDPSQTSLLCC